MTVNSTGTGHIDSKILSNGAYTLNYYCSDIFGNLNNTEKVSFSVNVLSPSSRASSSGILKPTQKQLKQGYERIIRQKQKIQVNLSNIKNYIIEIKEVNIDEQRVVVNINETNQSIVNSSSDKINLNNDGYYDLEISVIQIYNTGYAKMTFKEIHEKIPAEQEEKKEMPVKGIDEKIINNSLVYYILGFILVLVIAVLVLINKKKLKKLKIKYFEEIF